MIIHDLHQGTPEWHAHRASHFNASDAPAMMGTSPYKTRSQLLHEMATGLVPEVDAATQRRFDDGHRFEALARPLAEEIIGQDLYPVTGTNGKYSASFDGLTMLEDIAFEHKTLSASLRDLVWVSDNAKDFLPDHYCIQMEQQLMVSGAANCLFMATKWDGDTLVEKMAVWYEADLTLRARIIAGWEQFEKDLAAYVPPEVIAAPVAASIEALPALMIQVEGKVVSTNLDQFKFAAQTFIANIKTELVNDQDFADADKMVKFLKDGEDRLSLCKDQAQSQAKSIDELFRTIDSISEQMRVKRLALDKLVKAEKENRRAEIVRNASLAMNQHVAKLNERVGGNRMPIWSMKIFNDAVKGLKSLDSMRDKVNTALANAKIEANEIADRIDANRKALGRDGNADVWMFLFPDFAAVCTKAPDDFGALLTARIAKHNEAEAARIAQAKAAEDARIAAAVEAERKAGEARAAAAIESERMAAARLAAEQSAEVQRGKTDEARPSSPQASALYETASVSTPPTPEQKRAVVILAQDVIAEFLNSRTFGATPVSTIRAVLVEFVKFQSQNEMREAT